MISEKSNECHGMKQQKQHCPEVERLMGGRLPFVTRYGITIVGHCNGIGVCRIAVVGRAVAATDEGYYETYSPTN